VITAALLIVTGTIWLVAQRAGLDGFRLAASILNARRTAGLAGGAGLVIERLVLENHGIIGSRQEVENWLVDALTTLKRKGRTP
jgi:hypothetical protein